MTDASELVEELWSLDESDWFSGNERMLHISKQHRDKTIATIEQLTARIAELESRVAELSIRPTEDAYMAACRALHWRTAELRFHGYEPCRLALNAPHYPPDGYDFSRNAHR